jgi:asparagine synthase (glutamine-hydrolysing)
MCGIAGFYGSTVLERDDAVAMSNALAHRGPDGAGIHVDPAAGVALAHRRLSILDLSPLGAQPMTYADSGLWIVYNGEIYNFLELRRELEARGHRFRSESDTEVVLAAYLEWKDAAFRRLNGMWAIALYDERERSLLLCRDRYGIKPLYYRVDGRQVVFASEYKSFWAIGDRLGVRWDLRGLRTALESPFDLEASGATLLEGVQSLLPGHLLRASAEGVRTSCWWRTVDELEAVPASAEDRASRFRELFLDACRLRMRSDVPIGTALSGGLDSSSVVVALAALAARDGGGERAARSWRRAFVHAFPGTPIDETRYARLAAEAAGVEVVAVEASEPEIVDELDRILAAFESVYAGMPDSVYRVYRAQRRAGVVVTLDGHGADEMLAGYPTYLLSATQDEPLWSSRFRALLRQYREMFGDAAAPTARVLVSALARRPAFRRPADALGITRAVVRNPFLSPEALALEPYRPLTTELPSEWPELQRALYQDFHHLVLPRILRNFDLMSMAHGVEVRMPFMDYRLVNFTFSLPAESKVDGGFTKRVLRDAMRGLLPEEVRTRKTKLGFNSPLLQWLRGPLAGWTDAVLGARSPAGDLVDLRALQAHRAGPVHDGTQSWEQALRFWSALNLLRLTQLVRASRPGVGGAAA